MSLWLNPAQNTNSHKTSDQENNLSKATSSQMVAKLERTDNKYSEGAQWLSGRVLDSRPKGRRLEPHRRHCFVSLSKNINPS